MRERRRAFFMGWGFWNPLKGSDHETHETARKGVCDRGPTLGTDSPVDFQGA